VGLKIARANSLASINGALSARLRAGKIESSVVLIRSLHAMCQEQEIVFICNLTSNFFERFKTNRRASILTRSDRFLSDP